MLSPHETQSLTRASVVEGVAALDGLLVGGHNPQGRLAIYRRHHIASLKDAILTKFPATLWLLGQQRMSEVVAAYVAQHRPQSPAIADYGYDFPSFLLGHRPLFGFPYIGDVASLEWLVGKAAIAAPAPARPIECISTVRPEALPDQQLRLLEGTAHLETGWPVDDLLRLFVTGAAPDTLTLTPDHLFLEVRGGRGSFQMTRLDQASFAFRRSVAEGAPLGEAIEAALAHDDTFDPGSALITLFSEELVENTVNAPSPAEEQGQ